MFDRDLNTPLKYKQKTYKQKPLKVTRIKKKRQVSSQSSSAMDYCSSITCLVDGDSDLNGINAKKLKDDNNNNNNNNNNNDNNNIKK